VRGRQTAEAVASSLGTDYMSTGDPHFSDRYTDEIQKVTAGQLQEMARKYLDPNKVLTTALVPAEWAGANGLPKAEDLLRPTAATTQESVASEQSNVVKVQLDNNTTLLVKRITTTPLVAISMYALGGLTDEDAATNGVGSMAMDLLPRGTNSRSAQEIASFFDSIGGDISTACGNNTWYWNASCLKEDFEKTLAVYADVVNNPSFPVSELTQMKHRTLARIESQDADWTAQAFRFFKQKYYGPTNSPYQFLPIGTKENVEKLTPEQLKSWYADKVLKAPRVLAIYGDVDVEQARQLAQAHLGTGDKLPAIEPARFDESAKAASESSVEIEVRAVETQQTQQPLAGIVIGFDAETVIGSPVNFPIAVADTMASGYGYPTGYLHEILRGRGLVYVVHAQNSPGRSNQLPGTFLIYSGCDPTRVNEVVDLILENIARLQGTAADMDKEWFERSKQLITTSDAMDNETPAEQATTAALDELYGLGYDFHDRFADDINIVQLDDIRKIAGTKLRRCVVTVSTPAPELVQVKPGTRQYATFPPVDLTPRGVQHDLQGGP
jgi:zinc protease